MLRLTRIYDARPFDPDTNERVKVPREDLPICFRCGRHHAKVWVFEGQDQGIPQGQVTVGSGCGRLLVAGDARFVLTEDDLKTARRRQQAEKVKEAEDRFKQVAVKAAALVRLPDPKPALTVKHDPRLGTWNWVLGTPSPLGRTAFHTVDKNPASTGITDRDLLWLATFWADNQVEAQLAEILPNGVRHRNYHRIAGYAREAVREALVVQSWPVWLREQVADAVLSLKEAPHGV